VAAISTDSVNKFLDSKSNLQDSSGEKKAAKEIWEKFLALLKQNLKDSEINTWFSVISPKSYSENVLTVTVPSADYYGMIEKRYNKHIASVLESGLLGENGRLNYEVCQEGLFDFEDSGVKKANPDSIIEFSYPYGAQKNFTSISISQNDDSFDSNIISRHTFDSFVKGESNEYAYSMAVGITNNLGVLYNPYFLFGGVGLGKTHLVQAIGNEVKRKFPDKKVYYTTTPDFTTQFTTSLVKNELKATDAFYKSLDILILDDIQFLEGKPGIQNFVYQIFNTLHNNKKQLIFSSDKPINIVKNIEERLISRFQWGITCDIQPPNWEMRAAIVKKKLQECKTEVSEDIIHYIATNVKDSIRVIEGCIINLISQFAFSKEEAVTFEMAEKAVQRVVGNFKRVKSISIENIIFAVSEHFSISENQILSKKRTKEIAFARQVAMYLAKDLTTFTFESIGLNFGGKDHSTVLYAFNSIKEQSKKDKKIHNMLLDIKEKIKSL